VFSTHNQHNGETIDQYVTDLKTKAQTCEFKDLKNSLIRGRIVCGIYCDKTCSRLLRESDLTLQKTVDICQANETIKYQMKSFASDQANILPVIHRIRSQPTPSKQIQKPYCDQCGNWHTRQQICPALEQNTKNVDEETTLPKCATLEEHNRCTTKYPKGDTRH